MRDDLTPVSPLESIKKEAKRWLKRILTGDADAIARLRRNNPEAPAAPGLRDVQHALARERGFDGWRSLKTGIAEGATANTVVSREQALAALLRAADEGNAVDAGRALDRHPDILDERGLLPGHTGMRTALHFATNGPHEAVIEMLLDRGADPNIRCEGDWAFPLHFVAEKGRLDLVRLLIEHGADPIGTGDYHELDVIGWATAFDYVEPSRDLVEYLLAHGARHTIFSAVATGNVQAVRDLVTAVPENLERRMDLTNRRRRPLHLAVVKQQRDALVTLLDLGADPNTLDESGLMPLDQAVLSGRLAFAQLLAERGADMTMAAAVVLERTDDIQKLLAKDPEGLQPGHRWGSLIVRAAEHASGRAIETLIRLGASVDAMDDPQTAVDHTSSYTALHAAAWHGNVEAARVLLEHGANVRIREHKYCATPAGWAAYAGRTAVRDLIISGPIDIFDAITLDAPHRIDDILARDPQALERPFGEYATCEPDSSWCSPLAVAVIENKANAVRLLLERGADSTLVSPDGRTLREIAAAPGREETAAVLLGDGT